MKSLFFALISGFLLALGWPTYGFPLLLFFGFVPLLLATKSIRESQKKYSGWRVFGLAYITFFIFNICTTWWLYYSTAFGMWFAVLCNALLMATVWQLFYFVSKKQSSKISLLFLVSLWMLFEELHLNWEFSWPWLNLGNAFATYTSWIQWYEYTGTFGGTLWIWLGNIIVFSAIVKYKIIPKKPVIIKAVVQLAILLIVPIGISEYILSNYVEEENPVNVVILQPNIDPYTEKYNTTNDRIADLLFAQAKEVLTPETDFLIAPETVLAEGMGVNLRNFEYSPEKLKATQFLAQYPNLNYLAGIQFYRLYHNKKEI
ncbi:MAG: apolipoprotein N-acyltransferase, partial [Leeuwenhoekiella sp.]